MKVLLLSMKEVKELLTMKDTLEATESAFREKGLGNVQMPPKMYLFFNKYSGDLRVMPSYITSLDIAGVKVVNVHTENPRLHNLPTVMATILLIDPKTGFPYAVMDGTWITTMRTGAASGVATKYLARKEARVLSLVGCGVQAETQLLAIAAVAQIEKVKIFDLLPERMEDFQKRMGKQIALPIEKSPSLKDCVRDCDILSTQTPVREPIIKREWIKPGCHINAIGADAPGKQELDPKILLEGKVFIDDWEQALHSGEVNVPYAQGIIKKTQIKGELGDLVCGKVKGREEETDITIFDSTGLGIQDLVTASYVYRKAKEKGAGKEWEIF
jgi:alanine dehydrogenase|uniref:Putative alanine dehydrogenase n=1 Tax=candidate division WOR-3 bacterium TaxID=2052148 RepID=A0A7C3UNM8_UNCW3